MNKERANQFIKQMADIFQAYPNYEINRNHIYSNLTFFGTDTSQEKHQNLFPQWIERYKKVASMDVFVSDSWPYFCQFRNDHFTREDNLIKIYVPLDREHLYEGASKLFDFISSKNITHASKIGSQIRFDDIVIRTDSIESARQIQKFIDNNQYIQEGLISANPFAVTENNIAYGMDGGLSFNDEISNYISEYLKKLKSKSELNTASIDELFKYIGKEYQRLYIDGIDISKKKFKNKETLPFGEMISSLCDHEMITRILLDAYNKGEGFKIIEDNFMKQQNLKISKRNYITGLFQEDLEKEKLSSKELNQAEEILEKASLITYRNHNKRQLYGALRHGNEGDYKYFSTQECREELKNSIKPGQIMSVVESILIKEGWTLGVDILSQYADRIEKIYLEANTITNEEGVANENIEIQPGRTR